MLTNCPIVTLCNWLACFNVGMLQWLPNVQLLPCATGWHAPLEQDRPRRSEESGIEILILN